MKFRGVKKRFWFSTNVEKETKPGREVRGIAEVKLTRIGNGVAGELWGKEEGAR